MRRPKTEAECLEALKSMQTDKTPGTDGLPVEFYKFFWEDISNFLLPALNHGYETGCLSITQRRGIIKLIPKKDEEPFYSRIPISRTSKRNKNWFEKSGVREIEGGIKCR